ncbi:hypothetical protein UFOVP606_5 [uncultured Caudovirales phage]|uniref:Uncharacterized protein n=1 Tax=uncultured Caudovirales phage TaxID=2100421 RepID=A0A6J5N111_9CAUD|nr:hypothetical protein UFOVP606_5 [uncultured Caudovirales phage]
MADETTRIIKITLDVADSTKRAVELSKEIKSLNAEQANLRKSGKDTGLSFQQNKVQLAALTTEMRETQKTIKNLNIANKDNAGSNEVMRAQLSLLTAEYNKLSAAEREGTTQGIDTGKEIARLSSELKKNESAVGDNRRNVGNYGDALKNLKAELKAARGEMVGIADALGQDSDEFRAAAAKAGELEDKLGDVKAASKAMATGSPLAQFKNQLGEVGKSLMELDFKEAAEKSKGLASSIKNVDFKSTIAGAKSFAVTIYEVGAALMALPIFWIVAGIAAIAGAFYLADKAASESAASQIKSIDDVAAASMRASDGVIRLKKAVGMETARDEFKKLGTENIALYNKIQILEQLAETNHGLSEEEQKQLDELRVKRQENFIDQQELILKTSKAKTDALNKATEEQKAENARVDAENKKKQEEEAAAIKKANDDRLAANLKYLEQIEDQKILMIANDEERELAKLALDNKRANDDIIKSAADENTKAAAAISQLETYEREVNTIKDKYARQRQDALDKAVDAQIASDKPRIDAAIKGEEDMEQAARDRINATLDEALAAMAEEAAEKKKLEDTLRRLEKETFDLTKQGIQSIFDIQNNQREAQIQGIEKEAKTQIDALQLQADAGIITHDEYEVKVNRIKLDAAKKESDIKRKQFESQKKAALIGVAMKTAEGVVNALNVEPPQLVPAFIALALATGAIEAAVINSQPTPAFASGGKVLSGQRIRASDGKSISRSNGDNLLATVRTGEVILNESQQAMLGGDKTFARMGIAGFATGGLVDGGVLADNLTSMIDNRIDSVNQARLMVRSLPSPVVLVQDISEVSGRVARVEDRANI